MSPPAELAAGQTALSAREVAHLQRLLGSWGVLSDLSFSDLLLLAPVSGSAGRGPVSGSAGRGPVSGSAGRELVVLGQIRPTTGATSLRVDFVGQLEPASNWPFVAEAIRSARTVACVAAVPVPMALITRSDQRETGEVPAIPEAAQVECIPVPFGESVIAVVVRVGPLEDRRRTGRLERVYRDIYQRLADMVCQGYFPYSGEDVTTEDAPRVGDGLILIDREGRVAFASPNAMSALHRVGVSESPDGKRLCELGLDDTALVQSLSEGTPVIEEVERRPDVVVLLYCTPLVSSGSVTGAMVLLRDVTDLRRLDRLLLSKDAVIREVHHRVKNNLQTISSLLALQARRLGPGEGQEALREAERRVRSIALVHEILSREPGDQVPFGDIVSSLVRMAEDSVVSDQPVSIRVIGDVGEVAADIATPLAVVLAEVLQNAVEHAFPVTGPGGHVEMSLDNDGYGLTIEVRDDGRGLPEGFDIAKTSSLGLSIVRDLVSSQLGGLISMRNEGGTVVTIDIPLRAS